MKRIFTSLCITMFFAFMLAFPQNVFQGASAGLLLWFNTVLPTLLPFIIISNLLIHTSAIDVIARIISPLLCRFFCVSPHGAFVILTGFLCGCPTGSKVTADLIRKGSISRHEGAYLLSFCNNTSPMFIISYIIWQNLKIAEQTIPLLTIVMLTPALLSFFFRHYYHISWREISRQKDYQITKDPSSIMSLDDCIMNGFDTVTRVGGYIMLFSIIVSLIELIPQEPELVRSLLLPSLEITTGVTMICGEILPIEIKIIRTLTLAAFGGWCAAAQTNAMLQGTGLPILPYIIEKLITALATSLLVFIYLLLC